MNHTPRVQQKWKAPFFTVWTGQAVSLVGSRMAQFALVWWLTQETGSATVLAMATLAAVLPNVILGPFAGALVDRWNRRKVMIAADGFVAVVAVWLAYLFWTDSMTIYHVYVAMLARSSGEAFHLTAMQASTSLMVPEKHLSRVAGLNQTVRGILNVVAPPAGALLLSLLPMHGIMGIDVATALTAIVPLLFVAIPQPVRTAATGGGAGKPSVWDDLRAGARYVWSWPSLVAILVLAMVINFVVNPAFSLMPLLVTDHFRGGALELSGLQSAWGIGVVLGGLLLAVWGGFRRRVLTSLLGLVVAGCGIMAIGLVPARGFALAVAAIFVAGFTNPLINGPIMAILQAKVEPEMQGRVFTLVGSVSTAMMPLSLAVAGPLADAIGVRAWYVAGGAIFAGLGAASFFVPAIVNIEHSRPGTEVGCPDPAAIEIPVAGE